MRKRTFLVFITYIWAKLLLGLVVHPYQSVREITRRHILLPVVLSPLYGLVILFFAGRIVSFIINIQGTIRDYIAFILSAGLISISLWQLLLLYLLINFLFASKKV